MAQKSSEKRRRIPKQQRSRAMVDAILDATAQVLINEGYDHATTNKIASRAGVSIGSLYQYFPDKEALVLALNSRLGELEMKMIKDKFAEIQNAPVEVTVREGVNAMVESHRIAPQLHKVLVEQVPRVGELEKINEIDRQMFKLIRGQLYRLFPDISEENADMVVFFVFNIVESLTHQAVLYRPELLEGTKLVEEISTLVELYLKHKMAN